MEAITSTTKAVIPAAGLGTRLLPTTKEIPKEMLPIPVRKGRLTVLEPMLQVIFEQLYSVGTREFCFIVGRGKREIEDHFSADWAYSDKLKDPAQRLELEAFYGKLETSRIYFANQGNQKGFGGAVLSAEEFARGEPFMVHAGDDIVVSENVGHVNDLRMTFKDRKADAVLLVQEVEDPRNYGVVVCELSSERVMTVIEIEEKPERPKSRLAVVAVYAFAPEIFGALRRSKPDRSGEIQITTALESMIDEGKRVYAVKLRQDEVRIDIGTPESYVQALVQGWNLRGAFQSAPVQSAFQS